MLFQIIDQKLSINQDLEPRTISHDRDRRSNHRQCLWMTCSCHIFAFFRERTSNSIENKELAWTFLESGVFASILRLFGFISQLVCLVAMWNVFSLVLFVFFFPGFVLRSHACRVLSFLCEFIFNSLNYFHPIPFHILKFCGAFEEFW